MGEVTGISWTDSTFNPWIGCTKVSPACDNCYAAELMEIRWRRVKWGSGQTRARTKKSNWTKPLQWQTRADVFHECVRCGWRGDLGKRQDVLSFACPDCKAVDWTPARRRVFCASLADVFDNEVDPKWRADLFELIAKTPNLDWLLLTKRIGNVERMIDDWLESASRGLTKWADAPWPNVWLGITVCNQAEADRDIPKLLRTPAAIRFLSIEPMLEFIDLEGLPSISGIGRDFNSLSNVGAEFSDQIRTKIDWVIVGGESGSHARPIKEEWIEAVGNACFDAGVPFFFKQWGGRTPTAGGCEIEGNQFKAWPLSVVSQMP